MAGRVGSRIARGAQAGFSLLELLTVMVIAALLLAMLGNTLGKVANSSTHLAERMQGAIRFASLRQVLHRDVQGMADLDIEISSTGFSFTTVHCLGFDSMMPVLVTWSVDGEGIVRTEASEALSYEKELVLDATPYENVDMAMYVLDDANWVELSSWLVSGEAAETRRKSLQAIRITCTPEEGRSMEMVERLPHHLVYKEGT